MGNLSTKDTLKAETILRQVEGMSMVSALDLLDWCKEQLLLQPVERWTFKTYCGEPYDLPTGKSMTDPCDSDKI